jgi:hypothetical protein
VPLQINELTDRVKIFDDDAVSEQNLATGAYKQGWRTYRVAVSGDCIKAGGAK